MKLRLVIFSFLLLIAQIAFGQNEDNNETDSDPVVDSLLQEYASATSDTARLRLCREIGSESYDTDTVEKYSKIGISLFKGYDSLSLAYCYHHLGWVYLTNSTFNEAIESYNKSIEIYKSLKSIHAYVYTCSMLSSCYRYIHDYHNMWSIIYKALELSQQHNDTADLCICYHRIADYYDDLRMQTQCIEVATKGLELSLQSNDLENAGIFSTYMAMAYSYNHSKANCNKMIEWSYKAIDYYNQVDELDVSAITTNCYTYATLIDAYNYLYEIEKNQAFIDSVKLYIDKCEELEYDEILIKKYHANLEMMKHNYKGAEILLNKLLKYTQQKNDSTYNGAIYEDLYMNYANLNDYQNALKYYELYKAKDILKRGKTALITAAAYETESNVRQAKQEALFEQQRTYQDILDREQHFKIILEISCIGLIAFIIVVGVFLGMIRHTRKSNALLIAHNKEIEVQTQNIKEEKEKIAGINAENRASLKYSHVIQMTIFGTIDEIKKIFPKVMIYYKPLNIISGNWYWAAQINSNKLLAVGGSAKFGVPGALVCMITINLLKDAVSQLNTTSNISPSTILKTVKQKLPNTAQSNEAGLSLCVFGSNTIKYAGINQNSILVKNDNPIVLKGDTGGESLYTVSSGDYIILYSASTKRQLMKLTKQPELFCKEMSHLTPEQQQIILIEGLANKQTEDITLAAVKF